jgi:hypothetical protein
MSALAFPPLGDLRINNSQTPGYEVTIPQRSFNHYLVKRLICLILVMAVAIG